MGRIRIMLTSSCLVTGACAHIAVHGPATAAEWRPMQTMCFALRKRSSRTPQDKPRRNPRRT
jgi:hypothetical protein